MEHTRPDSPAMPPETEQQIAVSLDFQNGMAKLSVRGKFDIRPTDVVLPFAILDRIQWQRLTVQLQQQGVIPGGAAVPPTNHGGH